LTPDTPLGARIGWAFGSCTNGYTWGITKGGVGRDDTPSGAQWPYGPLVTLRVLLSLDP
jgi:hypothetical protein